MLKHSDTSAFGPEISKPLTAAASKLITTHHAQLRQELMQWLISNPAFDLVKLNYHDMNMHQKRDLSLTQFRILVRWLQERNIVFSDLTKDPELWAALAETLALYPNFGVAGKMAIHWGLFGCVLAFMGTERHHKQYLQLVSEGKLLGCFAMTELRGGSNVRALETLATYDYATRSIIVSTPSNAAQKYWIGGVGEHATIAAVFAQLMVNGKNEGVHVVLVPIRNPQTMEALSHVTLRECGPKIGVNSLDNGRIWFHDARVPVENLLDKFGSINSEGRYVSDIRSEGQRFAAHLGELVFNRVCMACCALSAMKSGLTTAIRYTDQRRQFSPKYGQPELPILDYITTQRRLIPYMASCYALSAALNHLKGIMVPEIKQHISSSQPYSKNFHVLASALKLACTWQSREALQLARECCGGQGYSSLNLIGGMMADIDHLTTVEGDNTVLSQQVARSLLDEYAKSPDSFTPTAPPSVSGDDLCKREFLQPALKYRYSVLVRNFAGSLRAGIHEKNMTPNEAWNASLSIGLNGSWAFVHLLAYEQLTQAIDALEISAEVKSVLEQVASLYGLWTMEQSLGDYLRFEPAAVSPTQAREITAQVDRLCNTLRTQAVSLVEGFGVPLGLLGPIAQPDFMSRFLREQSRL